MFYPASEAALREVVVSLLKRAKTKDRAERGVVVPHAGYVFSGPFAAEGFSALRDALCSKKDVAVILLGPSHYVPFRGVAADVHDQWRTPLGVVEVERASGLAALEQEGLLARLPEAFVREHSLEVQVPFLQAINPTVRILPLLVGEVDEDAARRVAQALRRAYPSSLWVISSDWSHYLPEDVARRRDERAIKLVEALAVDRFGEVDACGRHPLLVLAQRCREEGCKPRLLAYGTSADSSGDTSAVVGYAALAF
ncbi:AmmeMemoRadiSam system protein B [Candidatus Woesearchaeota archaeon]|nr:MAG: AmmeMemoRadiSam system protein B [Candidatus Woesearchaeota archaeon]